MVLFKDLTWRNARIADANLDRETRVRVYTANGMQICLPGLGEGSDRLTFPRCYTVGAALNGAQWVRFATSAEMDEDIRNGCSLESVQWWRVSEVQPRTLMHQNNTVALPDDPIGLVGDIVDALPQKAKVQLVEDVLPNCDFEEVPKPTTPSPR